MTRNDGVGVALMIEVEEEAEEIHQVTTVGVVTTELVSAVVAAIIPCRHLPDVAHLPLLGS